MIQEKEETKKLAMVQGEFFFPLFICFFFSKADVVMKLWYWRFIGDLYYDKEGGGYQFNSEMSAPVMLTWENIGSIREEANVVTRQRWLGLFGAPALWSPKVGYSGREENFLCKSVYGDDWLSGSSVLRNYRSGGCLRRASVFIKDHLRSSSLHLPERASSQ